MDDLETYAAAREKTVSAQAESAQKSPRTRKTIAWLIFLSFVAFLPLPVYAIVAAGFTTAMFVVLPALLYVLEGEPITLIGFALALVLIGLYLLPCWGLTRLVMFCLRSWRDAYAVIVCIFIVGAMTWVGASAKILGVAHNTGRTQTAMQVLIEGIQKLQDDRDKSPRGP